MNNYKKLKLELIFIIRTIIKKTKLILHIYKITYNINNYRFL